MYSSIHSPTTSHLLFSRERRRQRMRAFLATLDRERRLPWPLPPKPGLTTSPKAKP